MTTSLPGGYDDLHGYCLFYVQNSSLCYNPATQAWLIPSILASSVSSLNLSVTGSAAIASAAIGTLTAGGQSVCEVNVTNCGILTGALTTTASASDAVTLTDLTSSSHCAAPVPTNASASTVTGLYVTPSANTLTVFHNAAAGMTFAVMCTVY
jgi:hypothetical protein